MAAIPELPLDFVFVFAIFFSYEEICEEHLQPASIAGLHWLKPITLKVKGECQSHRRMQIEADRIGWQLNS